MTTDPPERLNLAEHILDARVREGPGARVALRTDQGTLTYAEVQALANRFAHRLAASSVEPEQRVILALPDGPEFVGALFGTLKRGAVAVMLNPGLAADEIAHQLAYTGARALVVHRDTAAAFEEAARRVRLAPAVLVVGTPPCDRALAEAPATFENHDSHRDDAAIWLFSGGTTGRPKAVVQSHRSFAYTTACYAREVIGYRADDVTLSVPKLYFGYATGSNLLFPFAAGASVALFPEPATAATLRERIRRFRPTVLVNVPTMVNKMIADAETTREDLASLRLATSAGEALPAELHARWMERFGVELLDGLGTAEMWHIFISNRPGAVQPGTLGQVVPGFEIRVCDDAGQPLPADETGWLWVRGGARAIGYWRHMDRTQQTFRGEWVVTGDLVRMDREGTVTYCGRGDELLKVSGKWLAPADVEGCLLQHPAVSEAAVIGKADAHGLVKPVAFVVAREPSEGLAEELRAFARERLEPYKHPREIVFVDALPRTHLGKVDRGRLRRPS